MPLVQAKCTNCGANLEVDNSKDAAICTYCGTPFIVEKAIHNYNTTNNIQAGVVNIYGGNSADFVITAGKLLEYNGVSTNVVIPDTVKEIGSGVFEGYSYLTSIQIPNSVTSIGINAFKGCSSLKNITIPNSVTSIGWYAFSNCTALTSITIPNSVTNIGKGAFGSCEAVTSITIQNGVTSIGEEAFAFCTALTSITIPNSVTNIEDSAFRYCTSLTSVTLPNRMINMGRGVFYDCIKLSEVQNYYDEYSWCNAGPFFEKKWKEKEREEMAERRRRGVCQHCGGVFEGILKKRCKRCRNPKDY